MKVVRKESEKNCARIETVIFGSCLQYKGEVYILGQQKGYDESSTRALKIVKVTNGRIETIPWGTMVEPIKCSLVIE